jgi:hypothetical protein
MRTSSCLVARMPLSNALRFNVDAGSIQVDDVEPTEPAAERRVLLMLQPQPRELDRRKALGYRSPREFIAAHGSSRSCPSRSGLTGVVFWQHL